MITGASSGFELEFCLELVKGGCKIVAAARRIGRLESLCQQINHMDATSTSGGHRQAIAVELDVMAEGKAIEASAQKAWDGIGCRILVQMSRLRRSNTILQDFASRILEEVNRRICVTGWFPSVTYLYTRTDPGILILLVGPKV